MGLEQARFKGLVSIWVARPGKGVLRFQMVIEGARHSWVAHGEGNLARVIFRQGIGREVAG